MIGNILGFIVMDGKTILYGTLSDEGNTREVLHEFAFDGPVWARRGGQSSVDAGRLRQKALKDYIRKTSELATRFFINPETQKPNVAWLIISLGSIFKSFMSVPSIDPRLVAMILGGVCGEEPANFLNEVDAVCGEEMGFDPRVLAKILNKNSAHVGEITGLDPRLSAKLLNVVRVSCGGEKGFDEAIAKISIS